MIETFKCPVCGHESVLHKTDLRRENGRGYNGNSYFFTCDNCHLVKGDSSWDVNQTIDRALTDAAVSWNNKVLEISNIMKQNPNITFKQKIEDIK